MTDYETCKAYQVKMPADGICVGEAGNKCLHCPAYHRYIKKLAKNKLETVHCKDCAYCEVNDYTGWCSYWDSKVFIDGFCSNGRKADERETGGEGGGKTD